MSTENDLNRRQRYEDERTARNAAAQASQQMASSAIEERLQNPEFLDKIQDPDADSDLHDWVSDELGPLLSGAHVLGNREREGYERQIKWLGQNKAERLVTEANPGRLLKQHEDVLQVFQSAKDDQELTQPMRQEERRVMRDGMEVVTNRKSLAAGNTGLDSVTTATAENRVVQNKQEDTSKARNRVKAFFE
jgi:hypothetical protein